MRTVTRLRRRLIQTLGFKLSPPMLAQSYPQYEIGRKSYGPLEIVDFNDGGRLRMGAYCSTAEGSRVLLGGGHRIDWVTTYPFSVTEPTLLEVCGHSISRGDVVIGNDVWIATDAMILSGVEIGDGAVIMTGAVVTRNVAPYAVVGGVPAREVNKRFDQTTIDRLLKLKWWDWPHDRIVRAGRMMLSPDIGPFLDQAEAGEI